MWEQTCLKYMRVMNLRSRFNFTIINPLETADLEKMLHIFLFYMETIQMLSLFLENSHFPCIIAIFWSKIFLEIKIIYNFLNFSYWFVTGYNATLLKTGWYEISFLSRCLWHISHIYSFSNIDFTGWDNSALKMWYFSNLNNLTLSK